METTAVANSTSPTALFDDLGLDLKAENEALESASAEERVAWATRHFKGEVMLSSSFGAQAAVSLHMAVQAWPEIPVVVVDTGYLFPETYVFIESLKARLNLNLKIYSNPMSPAFQESTYGKLWDIGLLGIEQYNKMNKVEPMDRAQKELGVRAWIAGLRRQQSSSRGNLKVLGIKNGVLKIHPIVDWTDKNIYDYLKKHELPYHPLWHKGYVSIGDTHTTQALTGDMTAEQTRFFGLKRECGLHDNTASDFSI
ncbi:phosphoadenylyl-sulfate reductase [Verrucomicrobia bacterium]|nr:phosphoadenylyl-sulfate reductase [Verrucomicrobiota bacterium]